MKRFRFVFLCAFCVLLMLLCACTQKIPLSSGEVTGDARSVTAVVTPEDLALLDDVETLVSADFSGSTCYEELMAWGEAHPLVEMIYTVPFTNGVIAENSAQELDLTGTTDAGAEDALERLAYLPQLKSVNLGSAKDGLSPSTALRFFDRYPEIAFTYSCELFGKTSRLDEKTLDLTQTSAQDIRGALDVIACLRQLKTIKLGTEDRDLPLSWGDILALRETVSEDVVIDYSFTLYGQPLTLEDDSINLDYIRIEDEGEALLAAARCMPRLRRVDMDSCGITNTRMAEIRDALPDAEVVWRIFFGVTYTLKTDAVKVLASAPSWGGKELGNDDIEVLKYCTKLKYVDLGHNESITDLSVVRYWPDLEVLVIAMNPLGDLTPLADCENLEYLELFYSNTDDLSPLAGLKNLKHLNVGHCPFLTDISSIYDLELERFYLGLFNFCPVPEEQVDHYRELHPDCEVDNTAWESSEAGWRRAAYLEGEELEWYKQQPYYREDRITFAPRYALLRDQFGYDSLEYSVYWKDPTYRYVDYMLNYR